MSTEQNDPYNEGKVDSRMGGIFLITVGIAMFLFVAVGVWWIVQQPRTDPSAPGTVQPGVETAETTLEASAGLAPWEQLESEEGAIINGVQVREVRLSYAGQSGSIQGVVQAEAPVSVVQLMFNLHDATGTPVGSAAGEVRNLPAGISRPFDIAISEDTRAVRHASLVEVTPVGALPSVVNPEMPGGTQLPSPDPTPEVQDDDGATVEQ
ncbi:hypothetical protein BH23BAC4_BH23BAC4_09400 [soil metagenome]